MRARDDLYETLKKHVPDSLQYYLTDTWQKITLYDNKVEAASVAATGRPGEYKVTMRVNIDKVWIDDKGNDVPALGMNDYIDIGVFDDPGRDSTGRLQPRILDSRRYKLTRGEHELTIVVKGKPKAVAVDPQGYLIDRNMRDNGRGVD